MSDVETNSVNWTVRDIHPDTVQQIRELAVRFRVRQADVIEEAIAHIEWVWATHTGLPEGWTKPREG